MGVGVSVGFRVGLRTWGIFEFILNSVAWRVVFSPGLGGLGDCCPVLVFGGVMRIHLRFVSFEFEFATEFPWERRGWRREDGCGLDWM